tara:strand:- start:141 stop:368 length:228 start_codon:yes stop_codon:yes gene_type:complete
MDWDGLEYRFCTDLDAGSFEKLLLGLVEWTAPERPDRGLAGWGPETKTVLLREAAALPGRKAVGGAEGLVGGVLR